MGTARRVGLALWAGLPLGRVLGIPLRLDPSWFLGAALVTWVARELWRPFAAGATAFWLALAFTLAFSASLLAHELAHALVARALGVRTRDITLFVFGGVARVAREPEDAGGEVLVAMAGPLVSATLAGLCLLAGSGLPGHPAELAGLLGGANLVLALFNLLPGFPLDGGRVARAVLWRLTGRRLLATRITAWAGRGLAVLLLAGGAAAALLQQAPRHLVHVVLGLFLYRAAGEGERAARAADGHPGGAGA